MWKSCRLRVQPDVFLLLCMLLLSRGGVLRALLAAALCHEAGHLLILYYFGVPVERVLLSARGLELQASMETKLSYGQEMLAVAAGPVVNLVLGIGAARLAGWYLFAGASFVLGLFNLLPVGHLDGGRLLYLFIAWKSDPFWADSVCGVVGKITAVGILLGLLVLHLKTGNGLLLFFSALAVLLSGRGRKTLY